ncbi:Ger(x)C family spore germination protein [Paenibacillus methanolicus]|uniref:Spore germination protein KC n=1 Tax=Paenibacillus methanolicus TaxID=582686 RepID=A0A5S5BZN5_9BACL|nr:Ger(x)C family spore germination protein [Paenibacillus methanolicus]TYP72409.1 spore germination protein KC [Paenibacillus methanolicus]
MKAARFLILLLPMLLGGCWDRTEINDQGIVQLTAFDAGDKPGSYQSLVQVALPKKISGQASSTGGGAGSTSSLPYMPVMVKGTGLDDMMVELEQRISRNVILAHRRVFIVGEKLARRGIEGVLDSISRDPDQRLRAFFVVARGMTAAKLAESEYTLEATKEEALRELIVRKMKVPSTFRDVFANSAEPGIEPIAAAFSRGSDGQIRLKSIAIFKDLKLVGYVDGYETIALLSLLGSDDPYGVIKVRYPGAEGDVAIQVNKLKIERKVAVKEGVPAFRFRVRATGRVTGNTAGLDLGDAAVKEKLDVAMKQELRRLYLSLFDKLQTKYKADSTGLGQLVYRNNPKAWKKLEPEWDEVYPRAAVAVDVDATVTQVGLMGAPFFLPEDEVNK